MGVEQDNMGTPRPIRLLYRLLHFCYIVLSSLYRIACSGSCVSPQLHLGQFVKQSQRLPNEQAGWTSEEIGFHGGCNLQKEPSLCLLLSLFHFPAARVPSLLLPTATNLLNNQTRSGMDCEEDVVRSEIKENKETLPGDRNRCRCLNGVFLAVAIVFLTTIDSEPCE